MFNPTGKNSPLQTLNPAIRLLVSIILAFNLTAAAQTFTGANTGAIPDGPSPLNCSTATPRNVTFAVTGASAPAAGISVGFTIVNHTYVGDLDIALIAPDATTFTLMSRVGATTSTNNPESSNLNGTYTFADVSGGGIWAAAASGGNSFVIPPGSYRTQFGGHFTPVNPGPAHTLLSTAFTGVTNPNGTWTLRFRDCHAADIGTISAASMTVLGPSAAGVSLSGRVITSSGLGIAKARITLTGGGLMDPVSVITNPFGYYSLPDVPAGDTYIVTVSTKRYSFAQPSLVVTVNDSVADLDFQALE